ncbi:hypothetical protein [Salinarimonas ramus]|uniref:Uncharacterized protein n=1 Tax=Salinarimonas ramus TaxID=690164 RepID=A0A917Q629_9HYPH|nr:hypothetical protein [Salinarimonas ramus]GGK30358.1 hypothetical protein GCM10011322_16130 [Salinarimonas ramus]
MTVSAQNGDDRARADWDDLKREASDAARDTAEEARDAGYAFVHGARDRAADYLERRKESAVQSIDDVAHSLRESSENFDDRPNLRLFVDSAADGLENLAEEIRDRSFIEVYADVEQFARRRPAVFAAAAGVAGFMLARFLKSSAEEVEARAVYGDEMRARRSARRYGGGDYAPGADAAGLRPTGGHAAERTPPGETRTGPTGTESGRSNSSATSSSHAGSDVSGTRTPDRAGSQPGTANAASAQAAANAAARPRGES